MKSSRLLLIILFFSFTGNLGAMRRRNRRPSRPAKRPLSSLEVENINLKARLFQYEDRIKTIAKGFKNDRTSIERALERFIGSVAFYGEKIDSKIKSLCKISEKLKEGLDKEFREIDNIWNESQQIINRTGKAPWRYGSRGKDYHAEVWRRRKLGLLKPRDWPPPPRLKTPPRLRRSRINYK